MLFPTPMPVADSEATEARFTAQTYLPEDRSSASLRVAAADLALNLKVYAEGQSCAERMAGDSLAGTDMSWSPAQMHGHDACVALGTPPAVSFLEWDEAEGPLRGLLEGSHPRRSPDLAQPMDPIPGNLRRVGSRIRR